MADFNLAVNEQSVEVLNGLAEQLLEITNVISSETASLKAVYEENQNGLGNHAADIKNLIDDLATNEADAGKLIMKLGLKLKRSAMIRQKHIDNNLYANGTGSFEVQSFKTDLSGIRSTLDLGAGDSCVQQLAGIHKAVQRNEEKGYESHHIPSAAVLKEFGIDKDKWPTIALTKEDHAKTDSYRHKQLKKYQSIFPDVAESPTYKEQGIELMGEPGGFFQLVRDEVLNIKAGCGDKYDGAIKQYLDEIEKYVEKNGIPKRKI